MLSVSELFRAYFCNDRLIISQARKIVKMLLDFCVPMQNGSQSINVHETLGKSKDFRVTRQFFCNLLSFSFVT